MAGSRPAARPLSLAGRCRTERPGRAVVAAPARPAALGPLCVSIPQASPSFVKLNVPPREFSPILLLVVRAVSFNKMGVEDTTAFHLFPLLRFFSSSLSQALLTASSLPASQIHVP